MNKIYLIFIVACLTEQLKANIYTAEVRYISQAEKSLANIRGDPKNNQIISFVNDINKGDMKVLIEYIELPEYKFYGNVLSEPCDMDPSTDPGTLAALLWKTFGIDSCPIKAGDYPINYKKFNFTGIIEFGFYDVGDHFDIIFEPKTHQDRRYLKLAIHVRLVQEDSSVQDNDEEQQS